MDILTLGEYNRKTQTCFPSLVELYLHLRHPSAQQVINIERRARRNTLHQRQINRLSNNNNLRLLTILGIVYFNPYIRQIKCELESPRSAAHWMLQSVQYYPYHPISIISSPWYRNWVRMIPDWEFNFVDGLGALEQNPKFFWMSVLVTKLHFIALAILIDTIIIIDRQ